MAIEWYLTQSATEHRGELWRVWVGRWVCDPPNDSIGTHVLAPDQLAKIRKLRFCSPRPNVDGESLHLLSPRFGLSAVFVVFFTVTLNPTKPGSFQKYQPANLSFRTPRRLHFSRCANYVIASLRVLHLIVWCVPHTDRFEYMTTI
jgi:hypothetical protein